MNMSAEKVINNTKNILTTTMTPEGNVKTTPGRVDINVLINRVRLEKQKENKINLVFLSLIVSVIIIVGIILSF